MTDPASSFPESSLNTQLHSRSTISEPDTSNFYDELPQQDGGDTTVSLPMHKKKKRPQQIQQSSCLINKVVEGSPVQASILKTCDNEVRHDRKRMHVVRPQSNQNLVLDQDQSNEVKGRRLMFRCQPRDLLETIKILSPSQVAEIRRLGWGDFLKIKIDAVESRDLYCWLLDHLDTDSMKLDISLDKQLPISAASVNTVLGVPLGGGELPRVRMKHITTAKKLLRKQLDISGDKITINRLRTEVAKGEADELSMKCFFMIAFNRMLFSTAAYDVSNNDVMFTMDLEKIATVNWCNVVVQDIRGAAAAWQNRDKKFANISLHGCAPYLLIYYLDQLDHELNNGDRISTPRATFFDKRKVEHITLSDRIARKDGIISYGATQFKSQVGTCYHEIANSRGSVRSAQTHIMLQEYSKKGGACLCF